MSMEFGAGAVERQKTMSKRRQVIRLRALAQETARLKRHSRRFCADALNERAIAKRRRALIRNTIRHYGMRGKRLTEDGYKLLVTRADNIARNSVGRDHRGRPHIIDV